MRLLTRPPKRKLARMKVADILRSIILVRLTGSNTLTITFSEKIGWVEIQRACFFSTINLSREEGGDIYLSLPLIRITTENTGKQLKIRLPEIPQNNLEKRLRRTDELMLLDINTGEGIALLFDNQ